MRPCPSRLERPRIIPVLLMDRQGLFKSRRFREPRYVGDPLHAVRILNDKMADELIILDATATVEGRPPPLARIRDLASECFMPVCYGGGIRELRQIEEILSCGIEKICLGTAAVELPGLIHEAARAYGSQSLVACVDVVRDAAGVAHVSLRRGTIICRTPFEEHLARLVDAGIGELIIQSIDRDGTGAGYDLELIRRAARAVTVPVIALGGAGSLADLADALRAGAQAAAAGSLCVFHGRQRAVLISYPDPLAVARLLEAG